MRFIGALPSNVTSMIMEKKINDIVISTELLERDEYIRTIMKAELLLAINYQIKTLVPGKMYDYWGSRRPIIIN